MAYQAKRSKKVIEDFELVNENGQVEHTLHVSLDAGSTVDKLRKRFVDLMRAQKKCSDVSLENADADTVMDDDLEQDGRKKFEDVKNYKQLKISISNLDLELGDIVGGRERITGITMKSPVVRKILTVTGKGKETIQYKLKGDE